MFVLNNNTINEIVLTLTESITFSGTTNSGFTMDLKNLVSYYSITGITLADTSLYTNRYNLFNITLSGQAYQDLSQAVIHLNDDGLYNYKCYYNCDEQGAQLLEQGLCIVTGITTTFGTTQTNTGYTCINQTNDTDYDVY